MSAKSGRQSALQIAGIVLGILLLALIFVLALTSSSDRGVVLLTPAQLARSAQGGPFTQLKNKLVNLTSPLWRRFRRNPPLVLVTGSVLAIPPAEVGTLGLGAPATTNAAGLRAWTLSLAEWKALRQRLKSLPRGRVVSSPQVSTFSGGWASLSVGSTIRIAGTNVQAGVEVTMQAKATRGSWTLTCGATVTEPIFSLTTNVVGLQTNFDGGCRATITNAGALVIQSASRTEGNGTNYWLILSPVMVDAQGKPITR